MSYEKLTPAKFAESLSGNKYDTATGARRAIGKADWADKDKNKAREAVDAHFAGKGAKPKVVVKDNGAPKRKPGRPKAADKAEKPVKAAEKPVAKAPKAAKPAKPVRTGKPGRPAKAAKTQGQQPGTSVRDSMTLHGEIVNVTATAIGAMSEAQSLSGNKLDVSELGTAVDLLTATLRSYHALVGGVIQDSPVAVAPAPEPAAEPEDEPEEEARQTELFARN